MGYNGWKNWETWNVALWLNNEESIYRTIEERKKEIRKKDLRRSLSIARLATSIKVICKDFFPEGTPDMRPLPGRKYAKTDFRAIAESSWDE